LGNGKRQGMLSMTAFALARSPLHGFIENTPSKKKTLIAEGLFEFILVFI
jgi:hypothetical protein